MSNRLLSLAFRWICLLGVLSARLIGQYKVNAEPSTIAKGSDRSHDNIHIKGGIASDRSISGSIGASINNDKNGPDHDNHRRKSPRKGTLSYIPDKNSVPFRGLFEEYESPHSLRSKSASTTTLVGGEGQTHQRSDDKEIINNGSSSIKYHIIHNINTVHSTNKSQAGGVFGITAVETGDNIKVRPIKPEPEPRKSPNCNVTKYKEWAKLKYVGYLASDPTFWMYQAATFFVLTNGMALEMASAKCKNRFKILYTFKAGKTGPIDLQTCYKAMCTDVCMQNDIMHQEAMAYTGCNCFELSTPPESPTYSERGDFCMHNSARMLCDVVGFCGIWGCRIDDFMCPRYEWNKKIIPVKGPGNCLRNSASSKWSEAVSTTALIILSIIFAVYISV
jgi:hypothetical protein